MSRFRLAPSILSADFGNLAAEVKAAEAAGGDWIHVDVMDGHFVPNLTIGPDVCAAIAEVATKVVDVHLMIENPDDYIGAFADAGADTIGVHVEATPHLHRTLQLIHSKGKRACVALNPATPASAIDPVLPVVEQVLVMSVNPGFGGQSFIEEVLPKIAQIRRAIRRTGRDIDLVVDGGVSKKNVERVASHGAEVFVTGSAFFKCEGRDYKRFVGEMRALLAPYTRPDPAGP